MVNQLRVIHVMADGELRMHYAVPGSRLVSHVVVQDETGILAEFQSPTRVYWENLVPESVESLGIPLVVLEGESDAEHIARTGAKSAASITAQKPGKPPPPAEVSRHVVPANELPVRNGQKMFREAWKFASGKVEVDSTKARAIVAERVAAEGATKLRDASLKKVEVDVAGSPQERAAYAKLIGDLRAAVNSQIASLNTMTVEELHDFKPVWPAV